MEYGDQKELIEKFIKKEKKSKKNADQILKTIKKII